MLFLPDHPATQTRFYCPEEAPRGSPVAQYGGDYIRHQLEPQGFHISDRDEGHTTYVAVWSSPGGKGAAICTFFSQS